MDHDDWEELGQYLHVVCFVVLLITIAPHHPHMMLRLERDA